MLLRTYFNFERTFKKNKYAPYAFFLEIIVCLYVYTVDYLCT